MYTNILFIYYNITQSTTTQIVHKITILSQKLKYHTISHTIICTPSHPQHPLKQVIYHNPY